MRELGIYSSGGVVQIRLRSQMRRLFGCTVQLTYKDANMERFVNSPIAESGEYWWNPKRPDQPSLWDSKIELSEKFFNEIISHPVPIDMNTLTALKRSTLGLDLYLWLYLPHLHPPRSATPLLAAGVLAVRSAPANVSDKFIVRNFRTKCLRELKKIKIAWTDLNYATDRGVLILHPSTSAIAPSDHHQLAN